MSNSHSGPQNPWQRFYSYFPEIELPVTLSEEYTSVFTRINKALPQELIETFILENSFYFPDQESEDFDDEIVEFVPCFSLPKNKDFYAVVYWKAALLKYEYILHTYDLKGKTIVKQVIASTSSDGKNVRQIVSTIDADLYIHIIGGDNDNSMFYDPEKSQNFSMEITPEGQIMHHFDEK